MALNVSPLYTHLINVLYQSSSDSLSSTKKTSSKTIAGDSMSMSNQYTKFGQGDLSSQERNSKNKKRKNKKEVEEDRMNRRIKELDFL